MNSKFTQFVVAVLSGFLLGAVLVSLSATKFKWTIVFAAMLCFPVFIYWVGSLKKALMAVLIFSLSTQMSFNPFWSDYYVQAQLGFRISLTGLVLLALYLLWLFEYLLRTQHVRFFSSMMIPILLLSLWAASSIFYAKKPDAVLFLIDQIVQNVLLFFYVANFIQSKKDVQFILTWITITILFTGLLTIAQFIKPGFLNLKYMGWSDNPLTLQYGGKTISRPSGFLGHANNLAAFLGNWLPLIFISIIGSKERLKTRMLQILTLLVGGTALVLTFSRGGWISFFLAIGIIFVVMMKRHIRIEVPRFLPRMISLALIGALLTLPMIPNIYKRITRDDYNAGESRITLAKYALDELAQDPIKGAGLGYYLDFLPFPPPHNIYLQTAAELGLVGFVLFMWMSFGFFSHGLKAMKTRDMFMLICALGVFSGLVAAYVHGIVELGTIGYHKFLTCFFSGGFLVGLAHLVRKEYQAAKNMTPEVRVA